MVRPAGSSPRTNLLLKDLVQDRHAGVSGTSQNVCPARLSSCSAKRLLHRAQMQQYSNATRVTHMDRVSTRSNLYRVSLFPRSEQVPPNMLANVLLLEGYQPTSLSHSISERIGCARPRDAVPFHSVLSWILRACRRLGQSVLPPWSRSDRPNS